MVREVFKGSKVETGIKHRFKSNHEQHLAELSELCALSFDLSTKSEDLGNAFAGRIFTLKNAMLATTSPGKIQASQKSKGIKAQQIKVIHDAGRNFIIACLRNHLMHFKSKKEATFLVGLKNVANGLVPFIEEVTCEYLMEKEKSVPGDILIARDPTGINANGLTAATLMQVCLCGMGYDAALLSRSDLDPKVTRSVVHAIVVVKAPNGKEYIIDPTHAQFFEDLSFGLSKEATAKNSKVLILEREGVDGFVEKCFMKNWKIVRAAVLGNNMRLIEKLKTHDLWVQYALDIILSEPPKGFEWSVEASIPLKSDMEAWVRSAYTRIWHVGSYGLVTVNKIREELIFPNIATKTQTVIKEMGLADLVPGLSVQHALMRLMQILPKFDESQKGSLEVLSLLQSIPRASRRAFSKLVDVDERFLDRGNINLSANAYFHEQRKVVNPKNKKFTGVYACSGADVISFYLSTNATHGIFVDTTVLEIGCLQEALSDLATEASSLRHQQEMIAKYNASGFDKHLNASVGAISATNRKGVNHMPNMEQKLVLGLKTMGVDLRKVKVRTLKNSSGVELIFPWKHQHGKVERERRLTIITTDITKPDSYPVVLKELLDHGIDAFYLKSSIDVPIKYDTFMPLISGKIHPNGFMMTSDRTIYGLSPSPVSHSVCEDHEFVLVGSPKLKMLQESLGEGLNAFPGLSETQAKLRPLKVVMVDHNYWLVQTIRQKRPK